MRHFRRLVLILAVFWSMFAHGQSSSVSVQIGGTSPAPIQVIASILERRFDSVKPGFFNSVSTRTDGSHVTVQFSGWTPSNAQTDYLLKTTGRFKASFRGQRDTPLIVESDVADSRPLTGREKTELAIRLTNAAAVRVESQTRSGTGKEIIVEWEGHVITRLRLAGPLSRDIALTLPAEYDVLLISAALRGGRIPEGTTLTVAR